MHAVRLASIQRHEVRDHLRRIAEVVAAVDEDFGAGPAMPDDEPAPRVVGQYVSRKPVAVHEVDGVGRIAGGVDAGLQNSAVAREPDGEETDQNFADPSAGGRYRTSGHRSGVGNTARAQQEAEVVREDGSDRN